MHAPTFYYDVVSPYSCLAAFRINRVMPVPPVIARGVIGVPTVEVGGQVFWGDDRLEDAAGAAQAHA